jgi:RimJ/RimL family protein N-acetyltransferase
VPPTTFHTERLTLRPWDPDDPSDVATAFDIYRRDEVARWLGANPAPWTDEQMAHEKLLRWQSWMDEEPGYGLWAIVPDGLASPVGTALLAHLPDGEGEDTEDVEVGWHLHPDHWGHGYATEAAQRLMEHARDDLGLSAINALAYPGNDRSLAVMRRLGMVPRGETDRWYGVQLLWWSTP